MRAVVQRVISSHVEVEGKTVGKIGRGLMVLLGVQQGDTSEDLNYMADKLPRLRIFADEAGKMNLSLLDIRGELLLVSQFTLLADCRKGRRPSFFAAEAPALAEAICQSLAEQIAGQGIAVEKGVFAADMQVHLINDGPVTIWLDSRDR